MPVILEVFANTGHQYFAFPLTEVMERTAAAKANPTRLEKLALDNQGPFQPICPELPWVRYRFDLIQKAGLENAIPILRFAVETNLGLNTRGFLYDVQELDSLPKADLEVPQFAGRDENDLEASYERQIPLPAISAKIMKGAEQVGEEEFPLAVTIHFLKAGGEDPIDVDLIVDLGNTRTAAVLLESGPIPLARRIYPLRILPRGSPFEVAPAKPVAKGELPSMLDDCAIIDSWLLLHEAIFAQLEPPSKQARPHYRDEPFRASATGLTRYKRHSYLPQAFVEISPALIGGGKSPEGAARKLARAKLEADTFFLSSPKRYVWDDRPLGQAGNTFWFAIPNPESEELARGRQLVPLGGLIRYFMEPGGVDWPADQPIDLIDVTAVPYAKANPTYPRRAAVCWFALSILEAACRQINSPGYRRATARVLLPRRLRWVRVTFPSGWTTEEKALFFEQWERAIRLFSLTHLESASAQGPQSPRPPALARGLMDEAVCSQLPIVYAQVRTLMNDGKTWIELYGSEGKLVVMNLDIGGGTTDMSIIEYQNQAGNNNAVSLSCRLLFRFGNATAGDMVVKAVIEKIVLPAWLRASDRGQFTKYPNAVKALETLFASPSYGVIRQVDPFVRQNLARITRLVLAPLASRLLQKMTERDAEATTTYEPLDIKSCLTDSCVIEKQTLTELNDLSLRAICCYCQISREELQGGKDWVPFSEEARLVWRPEQINDCIKGVFAEMFNNLGVLAARFNCHLVVVSGKPSELPIVRRLLEESFPILPQRIMMVKNFPAGRWYPFATPDGKIQDAKTCTVVGAALYQELVNGRLPDFNIRADAAGEFAKPQYYWGIIPPGGDSADFYRKPCLLFSPALCRDRATQVSENRLELVQTFERMPLKCRIGRQIARLRSVLPDPVYELSWEDLASAPQPAVQVTGRLTLKWVSIRGEGECLELVEAIPDDPALLGRITVKLKLNTMLQGDFWMDSPEFDTRSLFAHLKPRPAP